MQYHRASLSGHLNYGDLANWDYVQVEPDEYDLDELIHADDGEKLFEFAQKWAPFTKTPIKQFPADDEEELCAIRDTRELMLLVLSTKSLLDNGAYDRDALRRIGFRIGETSGASCEYGVVYLPSSPRLPDWVEEQQKRGSLYGPSSYFAEHRRKAMRFAENHVAERSGREIKQRGLHLPGQEKYAESLDDEKQYKVFEFGMTVPTEYVDDPHNASWIMDDIMQLFLQNIGTYVEGGIIRHSAGCNMLSFWMLVSERFGTSRIQVCRACGLPLFSSKERGAKRLYCNDRCERRFRRAKQFRRLVNEEKIPKTEAAKKAHIAVSTAERILRRNGLHLHPSSGD